MSAPHLPGVALLALTLRPGARLPAAAARHLEGCARCRADLADFASLRALLRERPAEPSAGVVARAHALLPPREPRSADASRFARARLVWDAGATVSAQALRAPAVALHQLWSTSDAEVNVREERSGLGSAAALLGQVFLRVPTPPSLTGTVWLVERGRPTRWATLGPAGDFAFPAPAGRRWSLWIEWGAVRLRLEHA